MMLRLGSLSSLWQAPPPARTAAPDPTPLLQVCEPVRDVRGVRGESMDRRR
jgi:hypothetical protein